MKYVYFTDITLLILIAVYDENKIYSLFLIVDYND